MVYLASLYFLSKLHSPPTHLRHDVRGARQPSWLFDGIRGSNGGHAIRPFNHWVRQLADKVLYCSEPARVQHAQSDISLLVCFVRTLRVVRVACLVVMSHPFLFICRGNNITLQTGHCKQDTTIWIYKLDTSNWTLQTGHCKGNKGRWMTGLLCTNSRPH
jgi:hypothetical protein